MLPFETEDKDKRKYVCFCCGLQFKSLLDYKNHILEKHEEGREYVKCPVEYCQFPVRCLRTHMKTKHPGLKVPENGLMRAIVWKDFTQKNPKGKTQKPKFHEGFYESKKMSKKLHFRSGWEQKIYECLDADNEVIFFDVEPFEIEYIHKGKYHKYIPDIIVRYLDGHTEILEIKPSAQTLLEKNQDKWRAANKQCQLRGWDFVVITEIGLEKWKNKVKKQLLEARTGT